MSEVMIKATLFKNEYKEEGDSKPDYQNKTICYPDDVLQEDIVLKKGQAYSIALWKGDKGSLSVRIQEAYKKPAETVMPSEEPATNDLDSKDIPF
tara:strand:+ start:7877 stop:8161 length:285 start_codon:yes stop_codon:yes gene_type:complete